MPTRQTEVLPDGTLKLDVPVQVPDVVDVLVVGGGPAGTTAAFRAKELGLAALVIDYDDLMKRIRDYAKDKLILPHFGGGDKMKFPRGGPLVARLCFDPIDKDDMCGLWKSYYRQGGVPARIGVELTGLERRSDGVWNVKTWNHRAQAEQTIAARHVVLAIGRGVPRRFDIPGNTDGISYHLDDAQKYVGAPSLVIGGGTSAAEAVIAISNAKAQADDPCPVCWSYRGDKMPKVSQALAGAFFDAYVGNGNIRYYPNSEPVLVVTGPDRKDYLSIRVDRRLIETRPCETLHLEFEKQNCIACIGEDIPEKFLNALGIELVTGGPSQKKRMVVTPLLETRQPNVYLIGDLLSQAYLETDDFKADPETFREVKHRGNIKSALRDGVFVAEVIKQKIEGRAVVQVELEYVDEAPAKEDHPFEKPGADTLLRMTTDGEGPPAESLPDERREEAVRAYLVRQTPAGVDEDEFPLKPHGVTTIGRVSSDLAFPEDAALSQPHASLTQGTDGYRLRDDGSETGTYLRLRSGKPMPVGPETLVRLGRQILLFRETGGRYTCLHYNQDGKLVARYPLAEGTVVVGRDAPDIILDAQDKLLSRRHLSIAVKNGEAHVKDLNSLNATYLRVTGSIPIEHDDVFRVGHQLFRLQASKTEAQPADSTTFRVAPLKAASTPPRPVAEKPPAAVSREQPATNGSAPGAPAVTFKGSGQTFEVQAGQTICEVAEANGVRINAECHAGICGSDPICVLSGAEYINEVGDDEAGTLEDICGLEPGRYRLACMTRAKGPVVVEFAQQH